MTCYFFEHTLITRFIICQNKIHTIHENALKIYERRTLNPNSFEEKVCCDFKKLEKGLVDYCRENNIKIPETYQEAKKERKPQTIAERMIAAKEEAKGQIAATSNRKNN